MFSFKIDVIEELKKKGINTTTIRKENLIGQKTLADIKKGIVPGIKTLDVLCEKLNMDIGEIIKYKPDNKKEQDGAISAEKADESAI